MITETYTREELKSLKVGSIVSALLFVLMCFFLTQKSAIKYSKESDDYLITAKFGRADGLNIGDSVMMSGIHIGKVIGESLDNEFNAIVTIAIDNTKIPIDSSASIVTSGLLSSKFISIEPGGEEDYLENGESFQYTQDSMDIWELVDRVLDIAKNKKK